MPIILGIFCVLPLLLGVVAEYSVCRWPKHRLWRLLPPVLAVLLAALVTMLRLQVWEAEHSPVTQLLFVPGLPTVCLLIGMLLGWRLWKYLWSPKVVRDRRD